MFQELGGFRVILNHLVELADLTDEFSMGR